MLSLIKDIICKNDVIIAQATEQNIKNYKFLFISYVKKTQYSIYIY